MESNEVDRRHAADTLAELDDARAALVRDVRLPRGYHLAIGLAEWLHATRYCPRCGGALEVRKMGHEQVCSTCGRPQFPRTDPAVIMLVAVGEPGSPGERCLLGRQSAWPAGRPSARRS